MDEIYSTYYKFFPEKLQEKEENELKLKAMEKNEPSGGDTTKIYEIIDVLITLKKLVPNETNTRKNDYTETKLIFT